VNPLVLVVYPGANSFIDLRMRIRWCIPILNGTTPFIEDLLLIFYTSISCVGQNQRIDIRRSIIHGQITYLGGPEPAD
jgi:hypothetical protein